MKTALIMGISGGFGGHVARQLLADGWKIKALTRHHGPLPAPFDDVETVYGDAGDAVAIERAAADVDLIVYGINPRYNEWKAKALPWLNSMLEIAQKYRLRVVFPGNVYALRPDDYPISEESPTQPQTSMGNLRLAMERRLFEASQHGASVMIIRCGDFIGKDARSTWLYRLIKNKGRYFQVSATGSPDVVHTWAYLPDVAITVAQLLRREDVESFEVFHFAGLRASFNDIALAVEKHSGKPVKLTRFPWFALQVLAPLSSMMRAVLEMRYLWDKPLTLSDEKLRRFLGANLAQTPLDEALVKSELIRV